MKNYISTSDIVPLPTWYWKCGLHDARIKEIQYFELQYDYRHKSPTRNYALITIDSSQAMFDTSISAIKFYNYKIVSNNDNLRGFLWKCDSLRKANNKFSLDITLSNLNVETHFIISFDHCELIRNL